jgi:hypothetical protein
MMEAARRVSWLLSFVSAGVVGTSWRRGWRRHRGDAHHVATRLPGVQRERGTVAREAAAIRVTDVENLLVLGRGCR